MRGDVYLADLNPSRGSEQAGIRPVIIGKNSVLLNSEARILKESGKNFISKCTVQAEFLLNSDF